VTELESGPTSELVPSTKTLKDKWTGIFFDTLEDIFTTARQNRIFLTPDQALTELRDALKGVCSQAGFLDAPDSRSALHQPLRFDVVAFWTKIHHRAVDLYYQTYYPRKAGMEGKPRRGASRLSLEYLDQLLTLRKKGLNPAQIASKLGHSGPKARGRIAKQIAIAEKRYAELVERVRARAAAQESRK
jgi:hypothetical protein